MPRPEARYARLRDLLALCVELQGSLRGIGVAEVARRFEVSERTAARMLRAVREALGEEHLRAETDSEGHKRWQLRHAVVSSFVAWTAPELATLDAAAEAAEREGHAREAAVLRGVLTKVRALMQPAAQRHVDPDLEALIEAQGHAMRPGPRPRVDREVVEALRHAILASHKVVVHHRKGARAPLERQTVWPLGFLYGARYYLVAWSGKAHAPRLFRLSRIERVSELGEPFEPPPAFDLRRFAENSFGVFQAEPVDVVWRFHPEIAAEASEYCFHPRQQVERCDGEGEDGSLLVRFRAGGLLEMAWHLFTWGPHVEVLEPPALREKLVALLAERLAAQRPRRVAPARRDTERRRRRAGSR
jgi:predicted DNA-binding transcriptional regulator YafY